MFTGYHDNKLINKVILNKRRWLIMWVWLVIKRACVLVAHGVAHGEQSPASKLNKPHLLLLLLLLLLLMLLLPNHLMNRRVNLREEGPNLLVGICLSLRTHYRFLHKVYMILHGHYRTLVSHRQLLLLLLHSLPVHILWWRKNQHCSYLKALLCWATREGEETVSRLQTRQEPSFS